MSELSTFRTGLLVIGGGAAGLAAASSAARIGISVLLADERHRSGGILPQCIHRGFGMGRYGRDMTGPEYRDAEYLKFCESDADYMPDTRILSIRPDKTAIASSAERLTEIIFDECILATGCMEKSIWSLPVSGTRPEGIYTAGEAQEMINLGHYDIGENIFILGSGDIGQIMARRLILNGKNVVCMAEKRSVLGGMKRNQEECIKAFHVPVILNSTVTEIHGFPRLSGVTLHHFDNNTDSYIACDTLITALGLLPDKSLAEPLKNDRGYPEWLHFCGNADYVHEIADSASAQGDLLGREIASRIASEYWTGGLI